MTRALAVALGLALVATCTCPPEPKAPGDDAPGGSVESRDHREPPPHAEPPPPAAKAAGEACFAGAECASGVCEGEGCGDTPGQCAPAQRACTRDLRAYCGCDGVTFRASGTCPMQRFAHHGECQGAAERRADGAACTTGDDCASGICEGQGCEPEGGRCMPKDRMCTMDLVDYCGCDGKTFSGSSGCPNRRYASRGACR